MLMKVIHVDMDSFFSSVEQRDNPELKGKPIAVGHDAERGVVSTASYEARRFGVHSAQSIQVAKRLCPQLIIVEPHFQKYKEVSAQLHEIFHDYTDLIEPISLDEAFLDVTENKKGIELGVDIAREIKQRIRKTTGLTASAGVSYCKFLAKIASDWRKPDGLTVIHPDRALDFIAQLKIEKIWGVGQKTAEKMHRMGVFTGYDLRNMSRSSARWGRCSMISREASITGLSSASGNGRVSAVNRPLSRTSAKTPPSPSTCITRYSNLCDASRRTTSRVAH